MPLLSDASGVPLAEYAWRQDDGEEVVSRFQPMVGVSPDRVARHAVAQLPGRRLSTGDEQTARALIGIGATSVRVATDLHRDVTQAPAPAPVPAGWALIDHGWDDGLIDALAAAYHPAHPDRPREGDRESRLRELVSGESALPFLPGASARLRDPAGRSRGQVFTVGPVPWTGQPCAWVLDVSVAPEAQGRGFGAALLGLAMRGTRDAGLPLLGLSVTDGNPALRLYERLGFHPVAHTFVLRLP